MKRTCSFNMLCLYPLDLTEGLKNQAQKVFVACTLRLMLPHLNHVVFSKMTCLADEFRKT